MPPSYRIARLSPDEPRPVFDCGDADLNEFFREDSIKACSQLMAVTYALYFGDEVAAYYCVSNDSIRKDITSGNRFHKLQALIPFREKRYSSMPAVKIGRFAVAKNRARNGIGSKLMSAIKYDFTHGNKTGCRFIVVDAYNKPEVIAFYIKNGFDFLTLGNENEKTRLMFFDLIRFEALDSTQST